MDTFKVYTYNCYSIRKNIDIVREILRKDIDFLFLQETLVPDEKLAILDYIDKNYDSINVDATFYDNSILNCTRLAIGGLILFL